MKEYESLAVVRTFYSENVSEFTLGSQVILLVFQCMYMYDMLNCIDQENKYTSDR